MDEATGEADRNWVIFPELERAKVIQTGPELFTMIINAHSPSHSLHQLPLHL